MIDLANQMYLNAQFSIALGFLVWLYLFRNESYYFVRNMFVVSMGLALIGYTLYPTAPPRMFPQYGFVDTITDFSNVNHDSTLAKVFINPYAAVPSMHCAFAMMIGGTGFMVCRHWWAKAFWAAWPLLISWVVIVTANHYWVDAALGWMVALAAALVASRCWPAPGPRPGPCGSRAGPRGRGLSAGPPRIDSLTSQWNLRRPPGPRAAAATVARPAAPRSSGPTPATA